MVVRATPERAATDATLTDSGPLSRSNSKAASRTRSSVSASRGRPGPRLASFTRSASHPAMTMAARPERREHRDLIWTGWKDGNTSIRNNATVYAS
jgi:hypothetical protein